MDSDNARLQKGEITNRFSSFRVSLAGAKADLIKAKTELLASKTNFERVTRQKSPNAKNLNEKVQLLLPNSLNESLELASLNNVDLLISKLNYEISIKDLKIERARLFHRPLLIIQSQKIMILVPRSMRQIKKL